MKRGSFVRSQFSLLITLPPSWTGRGFRFRTFTRNYTFGAIYCLHGDEFAFAVSSMLATKEKWACVVFAVFDTLPFSLPLPFFYAPSLLVRCLLLHFFAASDYFCRLTLICSCEIFSDACNLVHEGDGWHTMGDFWEVMSGEIFDA